MSSVLEFLIGIVKEAALLITDQFEVKAKDDGGDLVTNYDYEVEQLIIKRIKERYPDFSIVSEESNRETDRTDNCFVIDPIDGTVNFVHGLPLWGIQVACIRNNKTCASVIYLPRLNELYYADENGAFLNGKPISVNRFQSNKGLYTIEGPDRLSGKTQMIQYNPHYRDFYCCAVSFAWVACGRLSATCFVWDTLWDYLPGLYLVEKAGGVVFHSAKMHIAANTEEFLQVLKQNISAAMNKPIALV